MESIKIVVYVLLIAMVHAFATGYTGEVINEGVRDFESKEIYEPIDDGSREIHEQMDDESRDIHEPIDDESKNIHESGQTDDRVDPNNVFDGVYTECFLHLSFACLQKKTLLYLKKLNSLSEVSVIGDYVKFVKVKDSENQEDSLEFTSADNSEELTTKINRAIDKFYDSHHLKFRAMGKDITVPDTMDEFVGRKRKGGGGGGGGHGGHDDGGKKKMMMMAMMCMKMKFMMMVPAMMGMMGMMSFKGMMFSMMSFMLAKMMLLMKILEKKGGGGGDGGWAAGGGGGGGAWMPAGGQDYGGGGGGGGYDANGQWQQRSIKERKDDEKPIIYVNPTRYNGNFNTKKPFIIIKNLNDKVTKINNDVKSRKRRGILDVLQNAYSYWISKMLGTRKPTMQSYPKYKIVNGIKYVFQPGVRIQQHKMPKELNSNHVTNEFKPSTVEDVQDHGGFKPSPEDNVFKPIITAEDFNKGEIVEGAVESRMNRRKFMKLKKDINEVLEDSPWQ